MVVTYLLILTAVTCYACWRGYQLEVWVGELSKSVGQLAGEVTKVELGRELLDKRVNNAEYDLRDLAGAVFVAPKPAKRKPRGKK